MKKITTAQIRELLAIDQKRGLHAEMQELIARITDGGVAGLARRPHATAEGKSDDPRVAQAKVLWDLGFGRELKMASFEEYLATIPKAVPENDRPDLFDRLVLVDRRIGIVKPSKMLGLTYHPEDDTLKNFYDRQYKDVEFIWAQDGRRNRNKTIRSCRDTFVKDVEIGLTAIEGLCLYAHNRTVLDEPNDHVLDLPGSVLAAYPVNAAYLRRYGGGGVRLYACHGGVACPGCGSASRRDC